MWGRPVDVLVDARRRVARFDDYNGILYRVSYGSDGCFGTRRGGAIAFAALALGAASLAAADREAGRLKAEVCAACTARRHSVNPAVPRSPASRRSLSPPSCSVP